MSSTPIQLCKARDADEAYAIRLRDADDWLAKKGYGSDFDSVWEVEFQSSTPAADHALIDWEQVLDRTIEAYQLSDPVIANFDWPGAPL